MAIFSETFTNELDARLRLLDAEDDCVLLPTRKAVIEAASGTEINYDRLLRHSLAALRLMYHTLAFAAMRESHPGDSDMLLKTSQHLIDCMRWRMKLENYNPSMSWDCWSQLDVGTRCLIKTGVLVSKGFYLDENYALCHPLQRQDPKAFRRLFDECCIVMDDRERKYQRFLNFYGIRITDDGIFKMGVLMDNGFYFDDIGVLRVPTCDPMANFCLWANIYENACDRWDNRYNW